MRLIKEERFYLIVVLLLILIMAVRTPLDTDMWWHLRAGEQTWLDREVYSIDTFSHTREGADWVNHSWLSQLMMFGVFSLSGAYGLSIWVGLCAVISLGLIYPQMEGHPLLRGTVLLFAAIVSSVVWSPRPQLHSLVLFSALSLIIYRYRINGDWNILALVLPIFILWGNLHGGYVLGLILILSVVSGEILNKFLFQDDYLAWPQVLILGGAAISGFAVVLINPFGIEMWKIPFNTVGVETLQNLINEWASPDFHYIFQQPMTWMMLGGFSLMALSGKKADGVEVMCLAVFSWAALVARRNFGPFALVAAPIFGRHLNFLTDNWLEVAKVELPIFQKLDQGTRQKNGQMPVWVNNLVNLITIGLLLFAVGWKTTFAVRDKLEGATNSTFPVQAVQWMQENPIQGNLLNDYNWGGYLIWHLRDQPVFVDGRTDLFGDDILIDYLILMGGRSGWEELLDLYQIDRILVKADSHLAQLLDSSDWVKSFNQNNSVVFSR